METTLPAWAIESTELPVSFAQVREDPQLDAWVVNRLPAEARIIMIASGGCTVAYLMACGGFSEVDVVDPNAAQIALARLKVYLLQNFAPVDRLSLLGHARIPAAEREERLTTILKVLGLSATAIGPPRVWAESGPDQAGRYERLFAQVQQNLEPRKAEVEQLLSLRDPAEQARRVRPESALGQALDAAFAEAMDLPVLVHLFGEGATRNRVEPFARHFARRTRHALATLPAADNPYLWQVLAGRYPDAVTAPWLEMPSPARLPAITWNTTVMTEALHRSPGGYDFVHLSNILDWLDADEARSTLEAAHAALRPGGSILIRQLNSTLDIPTLTRSFTWRTEEADTLHSRDRSYFYRALHLGTKR